MNKHFIKDKQALKKERHPKTICNDTQHQSLMKGKSKA